jgi:hypothetical protein
MIALADTAAIVPAGAALSLRMDKDRLALAKATHKERDRAELKEQIFRSIWREVERTRNTRIVMQRCTEHADRLQARGFSASRLYNDYYKWLRGGRRISALLPATVAERGMPEEAVQFIHGWMQRNKRSSKQGWADFLERHWRQGGEVPGYGTWRHWFAGRWPDRPVPRSCPPDLPTGWTYENLIRKLDKVETAAARRGIAAALSELPSIPGTRADMRPLEWITLDDVKLDFRVHVEDLGKPVDVIALPVFDIGCALGLGFGVRPALMQESGAKDHIKRRDVKAVIVHLLQAWGWPEYGMHIIYELGTATFDSAFIAAIAEATGGLVQFHPASLLRGTAWAGGFADRAVGNSRAKSWLESWFNPLHNRLAAIEGQTGRRYDVSPQDDHGRRQELAALVKAGRHLPSHLKAELRLPYRGLDEVRPLLAEAIHALNLRDDHALQDFEELIEWRFREGDEWRPLHELLEYPEAVRDRVLTRPRLERPLERMERLMSAEREAGTRFFRLHDDSVPRLLEDQRWISLEKGQVSFELQKKVCLYSPYTAANQPTLEAMEAGREYLAYYDASGGQIPPERLYVTTGDGRWVGTLQHTRGISRRDLTGASDAIATKKRMLNAALARLNRNAPQVAEENEARIEQNLEVFARAGALNVAPVNPLVTDAEAPEGHRAIADQQRTATRRQQEHREDARTISAADRAAALSRPAAADDDSFSPEEISTLFASDPQQTAEEGDPTAW